MSNKSKRTLGITFLIALIVVGIILRAKKADSSFGWTLVTIGASGLFGFLVNWIHSHQVMLTKNKRPYWVYSVAVFVLWGIIFLVHWLAGSPPHPKTLVLVFLGYFIGWLGATIARKVYS